MSRADYVRPSWWLAQLTGRGPGAKLARGTGTAFAVSAAGTLVVFANQVLLARVLGADAYGRYIYAVTWIGLLVILSMAGLNASAIRFVAEYRARGEWGLLRGFVRSSGRIVLGTALGVAGTMALVVLALRPAIGDDVARVFWVGCVLVPLWAALELRSASLRGFKRILAAQAPPLVLRPLLFAAGVLAVYFLRADAVTAPLAMWVNIAATVVALGVVIVVQRWQFAESNVSGVEYRPREWLAVSLPLLLMAGFGIVLRSTDTIMLGFYWGTTEAGIYAVASRAAAFVPFMLLAVNTMAGPMISEYYAAGNRRALQRMLTVGARASGIFALATAVFLAAGGGLVLGIFGPEFPSAHRPMIVLIGGQLVNCLSGSVGYLMTMTGHQNRAAVHFGSAAALNIGLNVLLAPRFGAMGAAVATAVSMVAWNLAMLTFVVRRLRLNSTVLPLRLTVPEQVKGRW